MSVGYTEETTIVLSQDMYHKCDSIERTAKYNFLQIQATRGVPHKFTKSISMPYSLYLKQPKVTLFTL